MSIPENSSPPQIVGELDTIEQWRRQTNVISKRLNSLYISDTANLKVGNSIYAGNLQVNSEQILICDADGLIKPSGVALDTDSGDLTISGDIHANGNITADGNLFVDGAIGASTLVPFTMCFVNGEQIINSTTNNFYYKDGKFGIGDYSNTTPSHKFEVDGDIFATGEVVASSDISFKENLQTISNPIDKVKNLNGYTYNRIGQDRRSVGLVAQEVEKVLPEAVLGEDGNKSLAYGNIVALLVETVKEQQKQIEELKKTINKDS